MSRQLPGPGKSDGNERIEPSLALTDMTIDGANYLWGTVGNDYIYLIESHTGRGVFFFERPISSMKDNTSIGGLVFGARHLWIA